MSRLFFCDCFPVTVSVLNLVANFPTVFFFFQNLANSFCFFKFLNKFEHKKQSYGQTCNSPSRRIINKLVSANKLDKRSTPRVTRVHQQFRGKSSNSPARRHDSEIISQEKCKSSTT
ncbi:hypothetical protein HanRHA438_Chr08g0354721 [Helianthus annuus]|nr:hypothetical protein HanRHA438_Chr08g0354721 [Helianthus annuus]